jgi:hypothetical protein
MKTWLRLALVALAAVLGTALAVTSCTGTDDASNPNSRTTRLPDPDDVIDEPLMLALAQAKNFHHKAKVYMADGNLDEAIRSVRAILDIPFPDGAPEAEDVRLDAHARLAKLLILQGKLEEAMSVVDGGFARSTRPSFFSANLHTVKGEVYDAMAAVADDGTPTGKDKAVTLRKAAIVELDRAIQINDKLQRELLEGMKQ